MEMKRDEVIATSAERVDQTEIRWSATCPVEKREEIRAKMRAIKPRRTVRINHRRARRDWEAQGTRALAALERVEPRHSWTVRVYYRSQNDELLCFEATDLTESQATVLHSECSRWNRPNPDWHRGMPSNLRYRSCDPQRSDAYDADCWHAGSWQSGVWTSHPSVASNGIRHGARRVILPSQRTEPVEVIDERSPCERCARPINPGCICPACDLGLNLARPVPTSFELAS